MKNMFTLYILRSRVIMMMSAVVALFASCNSGSDLFEETANNNGNSEQGKDVVQLSGVTCNVAPIYYDDDNTRSTVTYNETKGMLFAWETGKERLSVFPSNTDNVGSFELTQIKSEHSAMFNGGGFTLTKGDRYFALGTSETFKNGERHAPEGCAFPSRNNLTFTYAGQRQTANESTAHLGRYDYFVASDVCTDADLASLDFEHLGVIIRVCVTGIEGKTNDQFKAIEFKNMEVYDSENSYRQPVRLFSMGNCLDGDVFTPKWLPTEIRPDDPRFSIALGADKDHGFKPNANHELVVYMYLPPVDLTGKTLGFILTDASGNKYYCNTPGKNMKMGTARRWTLIATENDKFDVTIKINHLWQHGAEQSVTRATTGDPGYEDKFDLPTKLYLFLCADGVVKSKEARDCTNDNWTTEHTTEKYVSTYRYKEGGSGDYKTGIVYQPEDVANKETVRLYAVAATNDNINVSGITDDGSTSEETLRALLYTINTSDGANGQKFMKNLYSTPWVSNETFVGKLDDPFKDVFLYHVAAKVDLKWNCPSKLTLTTADVNSVIKVADVKSTGLSLFKPTTNTQGTGYTVTTPITYGTYINGRQVYYLPQFSDHTYNVTIGTNTDYVTFTGTTTTGGFTSWLRGLITQ